jgi:RNA polymerase subunit RPABC4/transcription elongation factor Spt4
LLLHVVVRPRETVVDLRMERLRDTVLEAEADLPTCPSCRRPIEDDWLVCPACRGTLAHRCERCRRAVAADWDACPWCATSFEPPAEAIRTAR